MLSDEARAFEANGDRAGIVDSSRRAWHRVDTIKLLTILFRERKRAHLLEGSQLLSGGILKDVENGFATLPHTGSQSAAS